MLKTKMPLGQTMMNNDCCSTTHTSRVH